MREQFNALVAKLGVIADTLDADAGVSGTTFAATVVDAADSPNLVGGIGGTVVVADPTPPPVEPPAAVATQLAVVAQPLTGTQGVALAPIIIEARDSSGARVTGFTGTVTLELVSSSGVGGLRTVVLRATSPGLASVTLTAIDVISVPVGTYDIELPTGMVRAGRGQMTGAGTHWVPQPTVQAFTGTVVNANTDAELEAACAATSTATGDVRIVLRPQTEYVYNTGEGFALPRRTLTGEVQFCVRSVHQGTFPVPSGTRVTSTHAQHLAKIVVNGSGAAACFRAIGGPYGATLGRWRFAGIEMTDNGTNTPSIISMDLVSFGGGTYDQPDNEPREIVYDRCWIHSSTTTETGGAHFGVAIYGRRCGGLDTTVENIVGFSEPKAIIGFQGTGDHWWDNSTLEGLGVNVMFGGYSILRADMVPRNVVFRRCWIPKDVEWFDQGRLKNNFEYKLGQECLLEACIVENHRANGQQHMLNNFTVNQNNVGTDPTIHLTRNITFRYCYFFNAASIFTMIRGAGNPADPIYGLGTPFEGQLFEHCAGDGGDFSRLCKWDMNRHRIKHCTFVRRVGDTSGAIFVDFDEALGNTNNSVEDSIVEGLWRSNYTNGAVASIARAFGAGGLVAGCLLIGDSGPTPPGNIGVADKAAARFVDAANRDWRLAPDSPGKNAATDGTDAGADIDGLNALTAGCRSGIWS